MDAALQQFLLLYRLTPNKNASSGITLEEIEFAQEIRSVFDKLIPKKEKVEHKMHKLEINFTKWVKMILPNVLDRGKIVISWNSHQRISRMIYLVKGLEMFHENI